MLRQVSAVPTNRFHGLGLWPSIPVLLARVPHQTADCFYRPGTALGGMTAGKGGEELYKQKQALNVSYILDSYHALSRSARENSRRRNMPGPQGGSAVRALRQRKRAVGSPTLRLCGWR